MKQWIFLLKMICEFIFYTRVHSTVDGLFEV